METRCLIGIFALTAACAFSPAVFADDEPGEETPSFVVSSEFMDTLEEWGSPTATAETLALDSRPELIEEYAALAEEHHGGRPLAEVFAEQLPQTWAEITAALGTGEDGEAPAAADLLAYAMAGGGEEFQVWQAALADQSADFRSFVAEGHPEVMEELATTGLSPADQGVGLRDFAEAQGTAGGIDAIALQPQTQQQMLRCYCFTAVSFDDQPGPRWVLQADEHWRSGPPTIRRDQFDYTLWARGAARDLDLSHRSTQQVSQQQRDLWGDASEMRVNLTCLRMPVLVGSNPRACPAADACTGKLHARVGYASRVSENHSVAGVPWTRDAQTLSADLARLTYQQSGSPIGIQHFARGVAVAGSYQPNWTNVRSLATQFYGPSFPILTAPAGSPIPAPLNPSHFAALTYLTGVAGGHALDMEAGWDNLSQPYTLQAGQTHTLRLQADSRIYGRGFGSQSDTRHHLDSAYYMMAMTRGFSCPAGAYGPVDRAFWNYAGAPAAPYNLNELRNRVRSSANFLGSGVSNVNTVPGQYP